MKYAAYITTRLQLFIWLIVLSSCASDIVPPLTNINDPNSESYKPNPPGYLRFVDIKQDTTRIRWNYGFDNINNDNAKMQEYSFIIRRSDSSGNNFIPIDTVGYGTIIKTPGKQSYYEFIDNFQSRNKDTYCYGIVALRKNKESNYSNIVQKAFMMPLPQKLKINCYKYNGNYNVMFNWQCFWNPVGQIIRDNNMVINKFNIYVRCISNGEATFQKVNGMWVDDNEYAYYQEWRWDSDNYYRFVNGKQYEIAISSTSMTYESPLSKITFIIPDN
jgi:hypothetical protein